MKNIKISTQPYKGTTDTYPKDMLIRNYIFDVWKSVAQKFGYEEYDTPMLEDANLYRAKSGEELSTQLYNFTDKGGREVSLRPEMTPSLARIIASKEKELTKPIRWFNIGKFYRYEKPQRGRTREFFQLNIDILGISSIEAEVEILQYVLEVMREFKAPKETYEIRINNRYLLDYLFKEILSLDDKLTAKLARAIDNYNKMSKEDFNQYLLDLGLTKKQLEQVTDYLSWDIETLKSIKEKSQGARELLELFSLTKDLGLENLRFDPSIVRGLLYYTGTVIELFDIGSKENPRAIFGGGRYDDLLSIFGNDKLPAFGIGWGDVITADYLKTYNLIPKTISQTDIFVTLLNKDLFVETSKLATYLREKGFNVEMQLKESNISKQFKYANKKQIPWVIVLGEKEIEEGKIQLRNMKTGEDFLITKQDAIEKICL
jgi:histidyl-tRNA synthetase